MMLLEKSPSQPSPIERIHDYVNMPVRLKDGTSLSAINLANRIYKSDIGTAMIDQPLRYAARFNYNREDMQNDLGHDVCPIGHQMELPYHIGKVIEAEIKEGSIYGSLSDEEMGILMLAALVHDMGETTHAAIKEAGLTPVGDIAAGLKTDEDRKHEAEIRKFCYDLFFNDVDESVINRVEAIISHKDDSILHDLFEAGHLAQTIETSNYAHHALSQEHWNKNGEVIDVTSKDGSRLSGLLGIARVAYRFDAENIKKYSYFSHIRTITNQADELRSPKHSLLN